MAELVSEVDSSEKRVAGYTCTRQHRQQEGRMGDRLGRSAGTGERPKAGGGPERGRNAWRGHSGVANRLSTDMGSVSPYEQCF